MEHGSTRSLRRRIGAGLMVMGLLTGTLSVLGPSADAATTLPGSPYDGTDGVLDTHATIVEIEDEPSGSTDDAFKQGAGTGKESDECSEIQPSNVVQNNNDLTHVHIGAETVDGDTFLYLGFRRAHHSSVKQADYQISFELNQSAEECDPGPLVERTEGDLLIGYDGSDPNRIHISEWLASDEWSVPTSPTAPIAEASLSGDHLFGEAVINLHEAGIFSADECTSFASAFAKTRSSNSTSATLKDIVAPVSVEVSNCGRLVVEKVTSGDVEGGETFSFEVVCDDDDPIEFDLGHDESWVDDVDGAAVDDNLFFYGTECTVEETEDLGDTWTTTHSVKQPGGQFGAEVDDTITGDLTIVEGTIVVRFTNTNTIPPEPGTLKVTKVVAGDDDPDAPEDFAFEVICGDDENGVTFALEDGDSWPDGVTGDPADTYESFDEATSCTITETEELDDEDWTTSYEVFIDDDDVADAADDGDSVTVDVGPERGVHAIFTNTYAAPPGTLIVSKTVSDGVGNGSQTFQFEVTCDDEPYDSFTLGHDQAWPEDVDGAESNEFAPGTECSVSETPVAGWTTTHSINGGSAQSSTTTGDLTIGSGETTTVAFRNSRSGGGIIETTTTTVPPTTTTVPPTTTTVPPTTTTEPPAVEPVVVEPPAEEPTTTTATVLGVVQERELPRTGGEIGAMLLLAGIAMLLGGLALAFERPLATQRRRRL